MKLKTADLQAALAPLNKIIGHRQTLPILSCVRISANNGTLEIHASNLDEHQIEHVECGGDLEPVCVGYQHLLNALGGETMELKLDENRLLCQFDSNTLRLPILNAEEFVPPPKGKFVKTGISCGDMATGIQSVVWAASKDASRYILQSVRMLASPKMLRCESANGGALAIWEMPLIGSAFEALIPKAFAPNLADALERDGAVFSLSDDYAAAEHAGGSYFCKQVEGNSPNTDSISGDLHKPIGRLPVAALTSQFERCCAYLVPQRKATATVTFNKTNCLIEFSGDAELRMNLPGNFAESKRRLSAESFLLCLHNLPEGEVQINGGDGKLFLRSGNLLVVNAEMEPEKNSQL